MWCWRRITKIIWTDRVRNEELLHRATKRRSIPNEIKRRKAHWVDHILRRNCLLKHIIEGKIGGLKVKGRRERRRKQLHRRKIITVFIINSSLFEAIKSTLQKC
jgi:hypothetical protein